MRWSLQGKHSLDQQRKEQKTLQADARDPGGCRSWVATTAETAAPYFLADGAADGAEIAWKPA